MQANILFGPPGTGKTTTLLQVVKMKIHDGTSSDQICFITFTKKAATEAKNRMMDNHNLVEEQVPWFRTLHSLAFQMMGMNRTNVMGLGDYIKLCDVLGVSITYKTVAEDGTFAGQTMGDRLFFAENMARARMMTLQEYWESIPDEDMQWYQLEQVSKALNEYKTAHNKIDYTDIIMQFIERGEAPPCIVLIVDEAQDLSPLQWRMVERLRETIPESYIAGDDDQAIFRWAGADVDKLITLPGNQEVLGRSFRVPRKVQAVAMDIVKRIQTRVEKEWEPRDAEGSVEHITDISAVDMSQGQWLLLARNVYLLDNYIEHCQREGFIFECAKESILKRENFLAIRDWELLRTGAKMHGFAVKRIYDLMATRTSVTHGFKGKVADLPDRQLFSIDELREKYGLKTQAEWNIALDKMPVEEGEYYMAAIRRGEKFTDEPRIKISTIHGAKGGESTNVVIQSDMAYRTFKEMEKNPDDEHRVWYVGVTRTKENLFIIQPRTEVCYTI